MVRTRSAFHEKFTNCSVFAFFHWTSSTRLWMADYSGQTRDSERYTRLVGIEPLRMLFNYPSVLFGFAQYMFPFAVLMLA